MRDLSYLETFALYQAVAHETAIYDAHLQVIYPALGLAGEAGEVANKVKKVYRDSGGVMSNEHREKIAKEISMADVARENLCALRDRAERGTLHGDGDDR
jgi:NTP pyrophosphatase (non-canonical NTP hydrolase)